MKSARAPHRRMCESVGYDNSFIVGGGSRPAWKLGRVVEGAALEMLLGGNLYESSNLSVSALEEWPSGLWQLS